MRHTTLRALIAPLAAGLVLAACGSDSDVDDVDAAEAPTEATTDVATEATVDVTIAVTTTVLGDVVTDLVGDLAEVVTIMPAGANAHDFQASAREAAVLADADAIVVNGGGFEEGLLSVIEGAESDGVPVLDALSLLEGGEAPEDQDDHADDDHGDEDDHGHEDDDDHGHEDDDDHADEDEHGHGDEDGHAHDDDAHFFTDPLAVAEVVDGLADELVEQVPALDAAALREQADALIGDLEELHAELEETLAGIPEDRRVLVTDHDVLGSFADRYGFEVRATVIPTGSTSDGVSGGALAELASLLRDTGIPAVFVEQTASSDLADTLAAEVGDVEVVALYAESLGAEGSEADTYAAMMRLNAQRIADALGG
jgi:zinc/manganese transport system substrate-binding protein